MNRFLIETYDSFGRPYLSIPLPEPPAPQVKVPENDPETPSRGVVIIDMNAPEPDDEKFVFEF